MKNAPQHDFDYAQHVASRFAQLHGRAALAAQAPIRLTTGWWSPLFSDLVLRANTQRNEAAGVRRG